MQKWKLRKVEELVQRHAVSKQEAMSVFEVGIAVCRIRNKPTHCVCDLLRISLITPLF